ncbi:RluA family pseudouridine synthase [Ruminococcus sp. OA3]|uniref:RluA family pseudouridine synthase n=1 Tax=Ruminococcus sp. OA3 TaxID=2914164 RepID=UPI001F05E4AF|nr:RluA family pseudouridine synthase [Ruminococcus sp. OA3]MCH1983538.1 RluA family pseudouridine synthase [Ruminococcus sp. OA3]
MQVLHISSKESGQRLDKFLQKYLNQAPKSFIYKMLRKKNIVLNKKRADGSEKVTENDEITLFLSDETVEKFTKREAVAEQVPLEIVYEDAHVLIMDKPAGMLSQKARAEDISANEYMISYLIHSHQLSREDLRTFRPGVCNRLDRNTSGLLLAGKTVTGLQEMSRLLKERTIQKYYLCLVQGEVRNAEHISGYLHKNEKCNKVEIYQTPRPGASRIETAYEPLDTNGRITLLKVELLTGKTHQIRSHLAGCGHGIIGDAKYGDPVWNEKYRRKYGLRHQLLHAWRLCFPRMQEPFKDLSERVAEAELPDLFKKILVEEHLKE